MKLTQTNSAAVATSENGLGVIIGRSKICTAVQESIREVEDLTGLCFKTMLVVSTSNLLAVTHIMWVL